MKRELIRTLKYEKELLKMAKTPHQRDSGKHRIRLIKGKLEAMKWQAKECLQKR